MGPKKILKISKAKVRIFLSANFVPRVNVALPKVPSVVIQNPKVILRQAVLLEVPVQVAVPRDLDGEHAALDGQLADVAAGHLDNVAQPEDGAELVGGVVLLEDANGALALAHVLAGVVAKVGERDRVLDEDGVVLHAGD